MSDTTPHKFTKSDYLTPLQVAEKLNIDETSAFRALKNMYLKHATILVKSGNSKHIRPMVICARYTHSNKSGEIRYRLRSDALDEIAKHLQEQQAKGK